MSHATAVAESPDEMIVEKGENASGIYYGLGKTVTVKWMPGYQLYWCATCNANQCAHVARVRKWRETRRP